MKAHFKVKLTGPYAGYTGTLFGRFVFQDGVSVDKLHIFDAQLLATEARGLVALDDNSSAEIEVVPGAMPFVDETEIGPVTLAETNDAEGKIEVTEEDTGERALIDVDSIPDREGLEAIADREGISGLRVIAETIGVRGRSIPDLIEKILEKRG